LDQYFSLSFDQYLSLIWSFGGYFSPLKLFNSHIFFFPIKIIYLKPNNRKYDIKINFPWKNISPKKWFYGENHFPPNQTLPFLNSFHRLTGLEKNSTTSRFPCLQNAISTFNWWIRGTLGIYGIPSLDSQIICANST